MPRLENNEVPTVGEHSLSKVAEVWGSKRVDEVFSISVLKRIYSQTTPFIIIQVCSPAKPLGGLKVKKYGFIYLFYSRFCLHYKGRTIVMIHICEISRAVRAYFTNIDRSIHKSHIF
jgi:hypothetical protein